MFYIIGLGNPTDQYRMTRHNTGFLALDSVAKFFKFTEWKFEKKLNAEISEGKIAKDKAVLVKPMTFMNKSGETASMLKIKSKDLGKLIVIHDELDLPIGKMKISFGKSSGGHRGVESIIQKIKSQEFVRIRIGISKIGAKGSLKKPVGETAIEKHILGNFREDEAKELKKIFKRINQALEIIIAEDHYKAMSLYNS